MQTLNQKVSKPTAVALKRKLRNFVYVEVFLKKASSVSISKLAP